MKLRLSVGWLGHDGGKQSHQCVEKQEQWMGNPETHHEAHVPITISHYVHIVRIAMSTPHVAH